jgi:uncharacterized protein involved in outer membrane biogenesis
VARGRGRPAVPRPRRTPAQHVGHHAHRLVVWLGGIAAVLTLVVVAAIWRLLQGPVELDRLVPYVEQALQRSGDGIGVAVAGVSIGIDRDTHQLDLQIQNVRLSLPNGEKLANFPQMATSFSLGALLGGKIEPTRIVVDRPVLALTRDADGNFSFRVGNPDMPPDQMALDNALQVLAPLRPDAPWSRLRRIAIRDATIVVDDKVSGHVWRADRAAATLERGDDGAQGDLSLAVVLGGSTPELHASYHYAAASRKLDLEVAADGIDPVALAPLSSILAPLAQVQFPVSGTAGLRFDLAAWKAEGGRIDLGFGAGRIATELLASGGLPVASGELHAEYDPASAELRLDKLALDLNGGTGLVIDGKLGGLKPQLISAGALPASLAGTLGVTVTHVPAARLDALWPRGVSSGGRNWVAANLSDGILDQLAVQLGVTIDPVSLAADFSAPRGTMRFHDLTVDYFNGLPPAKKVSGTAALTGRRLDFTLNGGVLKSLKASGGTVSITDIGAPVETLTVDVGLAGALQDALEAIDAKPLRYAHEAGIDPARAGGKVDVQLHFKLPLLKDLKLDQVDYGAKATLSGVSYAKVAFDRPLADGNFTLDLGHAGVHAQGSGKFDGAPATIDGNLYFHPKTGLRTRYRIGLALDDEARRRLDWDFAADRLTGPVAVDLTYTVPANGTKAEVNAALDLSAAALTCDEAGWKKAPQLPASAKIALTLDNDVVVGSPQVDIKAPGLDARFAVTLDRDDKRVERVDIRRLVLADNDIAGSVSRRAGGGWQADISGPRLDLHKPLKRALSDDGPPNLVPLGIDAHVGQLVLGPHRAAQDVSAALLREGGVWRTIKVDGRYANGHRLALSIGGVDRKLHFESDDLGAALALFGIADNVVGGRLAIDGSVAETDGHHFIRAHIDGTDYRLVRAPALAKLLSLTSLDGIAGLMSGSGIPFTNLRGDVSFARGRIGIDRLFAYGGALGVTAQGWINPGQDEIEISGTLAPAYGLNSVLGNFPVLGSILMGGEGQSLFAASFRLAGSNDDPTVMVNPLSALTPGLLRHLFDPFAGTPQQQSQFPEQPAH